MHPSHHGKDWNKNTKKNPERAEKANPQPLTQIPAVKWGWSEDVLVPQFHHSLYKWAECFQRDTHTPFSFLTLRLTLSRTSLSRSSFKAGQWFVFSFYGNGRISNDKNHQQIFEELSPRSGEVQAEILHHHISGMVDKWTHFNFPFFPKKSFIYPPAITC